MSVELFADLSRRLPAADPDDRELTISCGAALLNLRLALLASGRRPIVETLPDPSDPTLLARVTPGEPALYTPAERELVAAIPHRRTNRRPFRAGLIANALIDELIAEAHAEGVELTLISTERRQAVIELIDAGDRQLWANRDYRRELASWIRPIDHGDGLSADHRHGFGPLAVRAFDLGKRQAHRDATLAAQAPALLLLSTIGNDPASWLAAGQALARVLLRATGAGLDASFFNQPIQVSALRSQLAVELDTPGYPQALFRIGAGPAVPPTPRRPLADVLIG